MRLPPRVFLERTGCHLSRPSASFCSLLELTGRTRRKDTSPERWCSRNREREKEARDTREEKIGERKKIELTIRRILRKKNEGTRRRQRKRKVQGPRFRSGYRPVLFLAVREEQNQADSYSGIFLIMRLIFFFKNIHSCIPCILFPHRILKLMQKFFYILLHLDL